MKHLSDIDLVGVERIGDWIQTYTGKQIYPLDPKLNVYDIVDIAAALSKLTRFNGHCLRFYSVAEHCVLMARELARRGYGRQICRAALMHDASEAYLMDLPRPVKPMLAEYGNIEHGIMAAIAKRFDFAWPLPDVVKALDAGIVIDECLQNMAAPPKPWAHRGEQVGVMLQCWDPDRAFVEFSRAWSDFGAAT